MSEAAIDGLDDSGATLAAGESDGTDNLALLSSTPKTAPFELEARLQLRPRVRGRLRLRRQLRRRPDLGRPGPGRRRRWRRRSTARARRTTSRSTTASSSPRPTRSATRPSARATCRCPPTARSTASRRTGRACASSTSATRTGPKYLGAVQHGLRLAHPHRAARAQPAPDLRAVVRHPGPHRASRSTGARRRTTRSRSSRDPEARPGQGEGRRRAGAVPRWRQRWHHRHAAGHHRLPRHHRLPGDRPGGRRVHGRGRDPRHPQPASRRRCSRASRTRTSPSGTAPPSATTARRCCSPTRRAAARARSATRPPARTRAPTRSTTSPTRPTRAASSYFKIPRAQTNQENCVAHNGNLIPNKKGRDVLIQSWYQGGVSVIDWTNPKKIKELAWFDRGPVDPTRLVARRLLVVVLLQRLHLRVRDPARVRRVQARRPEDVKGADKFTTAR